MTESIVKNTGENIGDIINGNNFMYAKNEYIWKYIVRRITNLQYIKYEAILNNNKIGIGYCSLNDNIICKLYENIHKIECIRIEYYLNNILIYIEHKNNYINLVYSMAIDINSRYILNHKLYNKEGIITSVYYTDNNMRRINVFQKNNNIYNISQFTYYDEEDYRLKQIGITEDDYINNYSIFYINDIYKLLYDIKNYIIKSPPTLLTLSKRLLYTNDIKFYNYFYKI